MKDPNYHLEGLLHEKDGLLDFEGPLSLILVLLQKNKIQIRDISISQITEQYLAQIQLFQEQNLDIASEFVQMASYLVYLKSKMMLSGEKETTELDELIESLEKLQAKDTFSSLKLVQPQLLDMFNKFKNSYIRGPEQTDIPDGAFISIDRVQLLSSLVSLFTREKLPGLSDEDFRPSVPHKIMFSIRLKSRQLIELLKNGNSSLKQLYASCTSKSELIATFISVLELCSMGSVCFLPVDDDYELSFVGGDTEQIIEKIVE